MSNTPIQQFFREHGISEVEAVVPDMAGIARGKVMPAPKFAEDEGMRMPESIFLQTVTGEYPDDDRAISSFRRLSSTRSSVLRESISSNERSSSESTSL